MLEQRVEAGRRFLYAILLDAVPGVETPPSVIAAHIEHLRAHDAAAADRIARTDPFVTEGVRTYRVRTWILAHAGNDYLSRS